MTNFTTFIDEQNKIETIIEEGFESSIVVKVDNGWSNEWTYIRKSAVRTVDVKYVYTSCITGKAVVCDDIEWLLHVSYYWLVKRDNGKLYPFPLLFADRQEREESASRYNDYKWNAFYEGWIDSSQLEKELVDVPSEEEISALLGLIEQSLDMDVSQWEDLDQRGGLIPRWAA